MRLLYWKSRFDTRSTPLLLRLTAVALQFPDELLADSAAVASALQSRVKSEVFILGDTSYASCCVDEVAAEHVNADLIVHYGRSCLSKTSRIPVLYVFGKRPFDADQCIQYFSYVRTSNTSRPWVVLFDVMYNHAIEDLKQRVNDSAIVFAELGCTPGVVQPKFDSNLEERAIAVDGAVERFGRRLLLEAGKSIDDYNVFFIGSEGPTLTNFLISFNHCQFYSFDPETNGGRKETLNVNKSLMKRYFLVQKAKDANIIGIVFGTLGVAGYLTVIESLQQLIARAGKKSYTFCVGKLNPAKLANFAEVDMYVLVACPETSWMDSQEFYRPIISPFELELACVPSKEWTGNYETDFRRLLPNLAADLAADTAVEDEDAERDFSLITGTYRPNVSDRKEKATLTITARNEQTSLTEFSSAGDYFGSRTFKGLEQRIGETPVIKAVEGISGIASGYAHEKELLNTDKSQAK